MPSIDAMAPSRFLKKAHLDKPRLGTIREIRTENVAPDNRSPEIKPVVYFREFAEGVPVGSRQREQLKAICGTDDVEGMVGKAVVLYVDPAVEYGGKMVGGIRFRAPKQRPPQAQGIPAASQQPAAPPQGWSNVAPTGTLAGVVRVDPSWMEEDEPKNMSAEALFGEDEPSYYGDEDV